MRDVGLRAQDILIAVDPPGPISARNVVPARVVRCEEGPGGVLVHLDAGDPVVAKVTRAACLALDLRPDSPAKQALAVLTDRVAKRNR